jgi:hypothetical protein
VAAVAAVDDREPVALVTKHGWAARVVQEVDGDFPMAIRGAKPVTRSQTILISGLAASL